LISIPASFIAFTAKGFIFSAGFVPAEYTSRFSSNDFKKPSAIWLRQEFPVHSTKILFLFIFFFHSYSSTTVQLINSLLCEMNGLFLTSNKQCICQLSSL